MLAEYDLISLWQDLAPNKSARALVIARLVAHHGTPDLRALYAQKIKAETFPCHERDEAIRILVPSTIPNWLLQIAQSPVLQDELVEPIRMDIECGRLSIALNKTSEFRLWTIGRELVRREGGSGKVPRNAFYNALEGFGVSFTRDHFTRLLRQGRGLFWRIDDKTCTIYINSPRQVAPHLVTVALAANPVLVQTNIPGGHDMYIKVSDSHEAFEAALYAGWMSYRENPTISREVLSRLFSRSQDTLRRWEKTRLQDSLSIRENYAQFDGDQEKLASFIPAHAQPYLANVKREGRYEQVIRYRWRIANSYHATAIRQHPKRGQNHKVYAIVKRILDQASGGFPSTASAVQPTYFFGRAFEKLYFHDGKNLKRYVQKRGCSERLLWRGVDKHGRGVFEPTLSYGQTYLNERARFKEEYRYFKKLAVHTHDFLQTQLVV